MAVIPAVGCVGHCTYTVSILFFITERKDFGSRLACLQSFLPDSKNLNTCVLLILIAAQVLLFNLNDETYAIWDPVLLSLGDTATSLRIRIRSASTIHIPVSSSTT